MAKGHHCFEILVQGKLPQKQLPEVIVCHGDDAFLRRETTESLLQLANIDRESARTFDGDDCEWIDVHDELATLSLFESEGARTAIVTAGDRMVKQNRPQLEKWISAPAASSVLILQLASFPSNTKLYKLADKSGWCVNCSIPTGGGRSKSPDLGALQKWIIDWGKQRHELHLTQSNARQILDAVGPECGLLHQELAKLALYADDQGCLTEPVIQANVGSWQTRTMWDIADAIADGRVADAMEQLEKVFASGEHPAAVVPQLSWSLRRLGTAANLMLQARRQKKSMSAQALIGSCGYWGQDVQKAEQRLRRIGLRRASKILDWLLELDLKIKGSHSSPSRAVFAIEEVCMRFVDTKQSA